MDAMTVLGHLHGTGKLVASRDSQAIVVQKPLRRGNDFFFGGYVHDVNVNTQPEQVLVHGKCLASQSKKKEYTMLLVLNYMDEEAVSTAVSLAKCDGCPAGQCGGLCQHIFALLMVLEYYGSRPDPDVEVTADEAMTLQPKSWGPHQRNVSAKPAM